MAMGLGFVGYRSSISIDRKSDLVIVISNRLRNYLEIIQQNEPSSNNLVFCLQTIYGGAFPPCNSMLMI